MSSDTSDSNRVSSRDDVGFDVRPGTPGLELADVAHVLVPGRGRGGAGDALSAEGLERITVAARLHRTIPGARGGRIVCAGYKAPIDRKGAPWSAPDAPDEVFRGVPEADLMRTALLNRGVEDRAIVVERHSIDTVTNLMRSESEGHFGDGRPVAIVAQRDHLVRILGLIAPRTLRRPYLGVVARSLDSTTEGAVVWLTSRLILAGLTVDSPDAPVVATRRADRMWRLAMALGMRHYH